MNPASWEILYKVTCHLLCIKHFTHQLAIKMNKIFLSWSPELSLLYVYFFLNDCILVLLKIWTLIFFFFIYASYTHLKDIYVNISWFLLRILLVILIVDVCKLILLSCFIFINKLKEEKLNEEDHLALPSFLGGIS